MLLEGIAARVEADVPPARDDSDDLCMVVASAHRCTDTKDCPACEARALIVHNARVDQVREAAASTAPVDKEIN